MRKTKKILAMLLASVSCVMAGCSSDVSEFDAGAYVESTLDCFFKGEYTTYMELTKSAEEDAKAEYEAILDENISALDYLELDDAMLEEYRVYFANVHEKANYTVKEVVTDESDNFIVTMEVNPLDCMEGVQELAEQKFEVYAEEVTSSKDEIPSEKEQEEMYYRFWLEASEEVLEQAAYDEPISVEVYVFQNEEGLYDIDETDLTELVESLFVY